MAEPATADLWSKFVSFIREFGLPSFLVLWFLFRIEKKIERFTNAIHRMYTVLTVILKTMDKDKEADGLMEEQGEKGLLEEARDELGGEEHPKEKKQLRGQGE